LGCTHFPVFTEEFKILLGPDVYIIDSAIATAEVVKTQLHHLSLHHDNATPYTEFLVTDSPVRFARVGELFLTAPISPEHIHQI
jgi:glutamate racemase